MRLLLRRETFNGFYPEALPMLLRHHAEIDDFPELPLQIDEHLYRQSEAFDELRIFTARLDRGPADPLTLIGYAIFLIGPDTRHQGSIGARQDAVYVEPEQRKGTVGIQLLKFAEQELRREGVSVVYHFVKRTHPEFGRILARQGYRETETVWAKRLTP